MISDAAICQAGGFVAVARWPTGACGAISSRPVAGSCRQVAGALGLGLVPAAADGSPEGVEITATAYEPIAANSAFRLETENSSELTLQVQQLVRGHLQSLGYSIAEKSLVLTIGTDAPETLAETRLPVRPSASKSMLGLRFLLFGTNSSGLLQERRRDRRLVGHCRFDAPPDDYPVHDALRSRLAPGKAVQQACAVSNPQIGEKHGNGQTHRI